MLSFGRASLATIPALVGLSFAAATIVGGCDAEPRPTLNVTMTERETLPPIASVVVTASSGTRMVSATTTGIGGQAILWPAVATLNVSGFPRVTP